MNSRFIRCRIKRGGRKYSSDPVTAAEVTNTLAKIYVPQRLRQYRAHDQGAGLDCRASGRFAEESGQLGRKD
jgi:hypothetical protein